MGWHSPETNLSYWPILESSLCITPYLALPPWSQEVFVRDFSPKGQATNGNIMKSQSKQVGSSNPSGGNSTVLVLVVIHGYTLYHRIKFNGPKKNTLLQSNLLSPHSFHVTCPLQFQTIVTLITNNTSLTNTSPVTLNPETV